MSVAFSPDGKRLFIGALNNNGGGGVVFVYRRLGSAYSYRSWFHAPNDDDDPNDFFGLNGLSTAMVEIDGKERMALSVGAALGFSGYGNAYVYECSDTCQLRISLTDGSGFGGPIAVSPLFSFF